MLELLTTAEMAEADRATIAGGVPGIELMERAGAAVAAAVALHHRSGARILVVGGPGNNGGDGFVAARVLTERGYKVRVVLACPLDRLEGDAALAAKRFKAQTGTATPDQPAECDAIIDALFGAGLTRPIEGPASALIEAMNASGKPIFAVDLPSGINGTTGAVMGVAARATETITFFRRKPGHLLLPGRVHCGRTTVADIGIPASVLGDIAPKTFVDAPGLWALPWPHVDAHKYARGHAVILSGGLASTGAARLAARGALRAGAGLVTIASPRDALPINAATNLAVMVRPVEGTSELKKFLSDARRNAILLGPGGGVGTHMRELVSTALSSPRSVVLDADAVTSFAEAPDRLAQAIRDREGSTVITPHEGEFKRVFGAMSVSRQSGSKLERARSIAEITGAVILLKGPDTVVAAPEGLAAIAENAPPWLATAGSGDVLAGMVTGLLAQGMRAFEAAAAAVWLHGEAGREVGPGLIAEDLPDALPRVYAKHLDRLMPGRS